MATISANQDERTPLLRRSSGRYPVKSYENESNINQIGLSPTNGENHWISHSFNGCTSRIGKFASHFGQRKYLEYSSGSVISDDSASVEQFKSTDWVRDSIKNVSRSKSNFGRKDVRGRLILLFDGLDTWILSALTGVFVATIAYGVTIAEAFLFSLKEGFCSRGILASHEECCHGNGPCDDWNTWSTIIHPPFLSDVPIEFLTLTCSMILYSTLSCLLTLTTKIKIPTNPHLSNLENAFGVPAQSGISEALSIENHIPKDLITYNMHYPVAGSGFVETRVVINGFTIPGFFGLQVLIVKFLALVLSISSGLNIGREGPLVHIAACTGNLFCHVFSKCIGKGEKYRNILSAAAAAGIAVTFGAPIGGVIFSLEEFASFYLPKTVLRTFVCSLTATLTLRFLNPYGNGRISLLNASYLIDWQLFELVTYVFIGIIGGATGALFVKATRAWDQIFRPRLKEWPLSEVFTVTILTAILSFWNPLTKASAQNLLNSLVSSCSPNNLDEFGLCPQDLDSTKSIILKLSSALAIKGLLMIVTFGIKIPGGIYIPSMIIGGLGGRIFGLLIQIFFLRYSKLQQLMSCDVRNFGQNCIAPGLYALIAAGSTMCGVTRLSLAIVIILLELTDSFKYIFPFSLAILFAKWTADALESQSIYDFLTEKNSYPFLSHEHEPVFESDLADLLPPVRDENIIDISSSPLVSAKILQMRLNILIRSVGVDGGIPITRDEKLVGILLARELKIALRILNDETASVRLANTLIPYTGNDTDAISSSIDFTPIIQSAYIYLDIKSPLSLIHHCFVNLGVGYICLLNEGRYAGMIHKRIFAHYTRLLSKKK